MKLLCITMIILNAALLTRSASEEIDSMKTIHNLVSHSREVRQVPAKPNKICNSSTEGQSEYNKENPTSVWICKNSEWIPYKLLATLGSTKELSAKSCKHIQQQFSSDCELSAKSGPYWIQGILVYCEMNTQFDKGGWTLVWQHSYMEDLPVTTNMTFFSNYYKPCTQHATSWCNIPNKARFNPTEQMIVAYSSKQVIYAYKGVFNRNIDYDWSGGYLMIHTQVIDKCSYNRGTRPNPVKSLPGIAFSKRSSSCSYYGTGGTIYGSLTSPSSNRWAYCNSYSSNTGKQMTLAIYIR